MEYSSFVINNTDMCLFIKEQDHILIKGVVGWEIDDTENHVYEVEIWWDGKVRVRALRASLNISYYEGSMETADIGETVSIMHCIETVQSIYFPADKDSQ